ncbi:hypothetical protein MKW94_006934 [Papaver nudicaule]|uniref:Uncharacterized protein n=1 Tax=Papaver nudicaule TaxID=74823 RepID=A0AA41UVY0_PAPNU|nr:hypothetical protein [Papaver nudicaule]
MAKISMFLSLFLFVLIVMPISSSSRMIVEEDREVVVDTCPKVRCIPVCPQPQQPPETCPKIRCRYGSYTPCCACPECCPPP